MPALCVRLSPSVAALELGEPPGQVSLELRLRPPPVHEVPAIARVVDMPWPSIAALDVEPSATAGRRQDVAVLVDSSLRRKLENIHVNG